MSDFGDRRRKRNNPYDSDDNGSGRLAHQKSPRHVRTPAASSGPMLPGQGLNNTTTTQQIPFRPRHAEETEQPYENSRHSVSASFDPDAGTADNLEDMYIAIRLNDYKECFRFLSAHTEHLKFSANDLRLKALGALHTGDENYAERCVQQSLILRKWEDSSRRKQQKFMEELSQPTSSAAHGFATEVSTVLNRLQQQVPSQVGSYSTREALEREASASLWRDPVLSGGRHTTGMYSTSVRGAPRIFTVEADAQSRHNYSPVAVAAAPQTRSRAPAVPAEMIRQAEHLYTSSPSRHQNDRQLPGRDALQSNFANSRLPDPGSSTEYPIQNNARFSDERTYEGPTPDSRHPIRKDPLKFGTVFEVLWHQSAPGRDTSFSLRRRMVVVKESANFCWCIAINSYGGYGLKKMAMTRKEIAAHAIIYMTGQRPVMLSEEPMMIKEPIQVEPDRSQQALALASRLNFAKVYTVESFNRVTIIGKVAPASLPYLRRYWKEQTEAD